VFNSAGGRGFHAIAVVFIPAAAVTTAKLGGNEKPTGDDAVEKSHYIPYAYTLLFQRADRGPGVPKFGVPRLQERRSHRGPGLAEAGTEATRPHGSPQFCPETAGCPENFQRLNAGLSMKSCRSCPVSVAR